MSEPDLRLSDLLTFVAVQRTSSVTGAARQLRVTPSQVSKSISRLERYCDAKLFVRGTKGVTLTSAGEHAAENIASAISSLHSTRRVEGSRTGERRVELAVAGPSYLLEALLPAVAHAYPNLRVRALELSPALVRAYITENVFDVAFAPGDVSNRPSTWTSERAGELRKSLFGTPSLAKRLGPPPVDEAKLRVIPWVVPASPGPRLAPISDDCPLPISERTIGHEAQTIRTALDLAATGEYLVFGPDIAARKLVETGVLVPIPVRGWDTVEPLFIACNGEVVLQRVREAVVKAVRRTLAG